MSGHDEVEARDEHNMLGLVGQERDTVPAPELTEYAVLVAFTVHAVDEDAAALVVRSWLKMYGCGDPFEGSPWTTRPEVERVMPC